MWREVKELRAEIQEKQKQYDECLREKIHYQTWLLYTQQVRNDKHLNEALERERSRNESIPPL